MQKPRLNQIFTGVQLLWALSLFFALVLAITLTPGGAKGSFQNSLTGNTGLCIIITLIFLGTFELILHWTKQAFEIDEAKMAYGQKSLWTAIALFFRYANLMYTIIGFIVLTGITCLFGAVIFNILSKNPVAFSTGSFIMLGMVVVYLLIRNPVASAFKRSGAARAAGGGQPTYALTDRSVTIDLKMKNLKDPAKNLVTLGFDEIDEIKAFTFVEAQTFFQYSVGPNLEVAIRQVKDLRDYINGKIPRPTAYAFTGPQSTGSNVFISGPNLFYFLTFNAQDVNDLVSAFAGFKGPGGQGQHLSEAPTEPSAVPVRPADSIAGKGRPKFCPNCGDAVGGEEKFCDKCGTKLG